MPNRWNVLSSTDELHWTVIATYKSKDSALAHVDECRINEGRDAIYFRAEVESYSRVHKAAIKLFKAQKREHSDNKNPTLCSRCRAENEFKKVCNEEIRQQARMARNVR